MRRAINAAPFCENYVKLYFDAKQRDWTGFGEVFGALFLKKVTFFDNIRCCPYFSD